MPAGLENAPLRIEFHYSFKNRIQTPRAHHPHALSLPSPQALTSHYYCPQPLLLMLLYLLSTSVAAPLPSAPPPLAETLISKLPEAFFLPAPSCGIFPSLLSGPVPEHATSPLSSANFATCSLALPEIWLLLHQSVDVTPLCS